MSTADAPLLELGNGRRDDLIGILESKPPGSRPANRRVSLRPENAISRYLRAQQINVARHAAALRQFRPDEFGTGPEAPSRGHIAAANRLVAAMQRRLTKSVQNVQRAVRDAESAQTGDQLRKVVTLQESAHDLVRMLELVWDFYLEMFGQRQSVFGQLLMGCDRVALDCYREAWTGLGKYRPVPAPPPFSFLRTGIAPSTQRRMIPLQRLGMAPNPFPIVQLPYHRIVNPWTLGAMLHEVSHNLQNELGLDRAAQATMDAQLSLQGVPEQVRAVWRRWHREIYADLSAALLGGPAIVASLIDILSRSPRSVSHWNSLQVHPTPILRPYLSTELLRRIGFADEARAFEKLWRTIYGSARGSIPEPFRRTFADAHRIVVEALCLTPQPALGGRSLARVQRFGPVHQAMVEQCGRRLGKGLDPGVVPERFLIGAARFALDNRLARPDVVAGAFYSELTRR
jgi:hypothetical protein